MLWGGRRRASKPAGPASNVEADVPCSLLEKAEDCLPKAWQEMLEEAAAVGSAAGTVPYTYPVFFKSASSKKEKSAQGRKEEVACEGRVCRAWWKEEEEA